MTFLDPPEGIRINELLKAGQPVAAAELLLASSNRDHKAIRAHVVECVQQLMNAAKAATADKQYLSARNHSQLAAAIHPLSGDHAVLHAQILELALDFERRAAEEKRALDRSRKLAESGRLQTSIESLAPLKHLPEGQGLIADLTARDGTVQRQVVEFTQRLQEGDLRGAEAILAKIEEMAQSKVDALGLRHKLTEAKRTRRIERMPAKPAAVDASTFDWMLDFGDVDRNTLLVFRHAMVIGSASSDNTTAEIQVAGAALHRQHAMILRHYRQSEMRYWLLPHPSHDKYVAVNGVSLSPGNSSLRPWGRGAKSQPPTQSSSSGLGCVLLKDGDVIELGENQHNIGARLVYRQRPGCAKTDDAANSPVPHPTAGLQFLTSFPESFQKQGINFRNLALVHKNVRLGSPSRSVDLPLPMEFDCAIEYRLLGGQLQVEVDGCVTDLRHHDDDSDDECIIQPACTLVLKKLMEGKPTRVLHRSW